MSDVCCNIKKLLDKENKKLIYGLIKEDARAKEYELAMLRLTDREKFRPKLSIRTSMADYRKEEWLLNLPLWAAETVRNPKALK